MNIIKGELKLDEPEDNKHDGEWQDYILNCFPILIDLIAYAMFQLCIIKFIIFMHFMLTISLIMYSGRMLTIHYQTFIIIKIQP